METSQREVQSGKVYRQIFDAEIQLTKALENGPSKAETKDKDTTAATDEEKSHIPVVHTTRNELGLGMLTDRQKTWMDSFPNESQVENPILYRHFMVLQQTRKQKSKSYVASMEVRCLPDVLAPTSKGSDIIDRISQSRKIRHETTLEDMHQELGLISSEMEPLIQRAGEQLTAALAENDSDIAKIMRKMEKDEDLVRFSFEDICRLWAEVEAHSILRQDEISQLSDTLRDIEEARMDKIQSVFQDYAKVLEQIAHLVVPDLHRLLDKESQDINQAMLSNRRAVAELHARLLTADVEREKRLHVVWARRLEDWRVLHTDATCREFSDFMASDAVTEPSNVKVVMEAMVAEQRKLNERRLQLIASLGDLKPPNSTKTAVYKWNQEITEVSKEIDSVNQDYFNKLYAEYETVCQMCLEVVEDKKASLIERGVCAADKAQDVVTESCLPLVGERQAFFEKRLEQVDKELEDHNAAMVGDLKTLFKFCQGAAHVWDSHELGLAKQERTLQENLDQCRRRHDTVNQDREANLDIVMDRLRQESTEAALTESLTKALEMLEGIKAGYFDFHGEQRDTVAKYPDMVSQEVEVFDAAVCRFFGVGRDNPQDNSTDQDDVTKSHGKPTGTDPTETEVAADRCAASSLPQAVSRVLSTAKGTTFYVLSVAEQSLPRRPLGGATAEVSAEVGREDGVFLTEAGGEAQSAGEGPPDYIRAVDVPDAIFDSTRKTITLNFLDHLEDWSNQALERAGSVVAAKNEELNSELDLRLHLHEPRAHRVERDVHHVRAAELVLHAERVARHCKGVTQALGDLRARFGHMTQEHNALADNFRREIKELEIVFIGATKSSKLVALSSELQTQQERYMDVIRTSLRHFRQYLDQTLHTLRESNARFIKSFKVFSDGGNFSPEEIDDYRKRLGRAAQKIDSSEGLIMADLEGIESKRLDQATKVAHEFEDKFKHHMIDLLFMEKIGRWLTNVQVKVKAEVADSNGQAERLAGSLSRLQQAIDACQHPNPDKEHVRATQLRDLLPTLFDAFRERSLYLNAMQGEIRRPTSAPLQGNPALGARVGFVSESTVPSISRPGKQPHEDPSVAVIKNILKTHRPRGSHVPETSGEESTNQQANLQGSGTRAQVEGRDKVKSRQSHTSDVTETRSKRSKSKASTSASDGGSKRITSGHHVTTVVTSLGRSKVGKIDPKYYVFGEQAEDGEACHLLGRVRRMLREALDGLLVAAELYYRQKGNRAVTRPQALQETFEQCADVIVSKLESYFSQAEQYHNQCLQELRCQVGELEELVSLIPGCAAGELFQDSVSAAADRRAQAERDFRARLSQWEAAKREHQSLLRPGMGHPQQCDQLQALCDQEQARQDQHEEAIQQQAVHLGEVTSEMAVTFVEKLARVSEVMLLQYDDLITPNDLIQGKVTPPRYPTSELIRRRQLGVPLEDVEDPDSRLPRAGRTWPGIPTDEFVVAPPSDTPGDRKPKGGGGRGDGTERGGTVAMTPTVTSAKTTVAHSATVEAREQVYQDYKRQYSQWMEETRAETDKLQTGVLRWRQHWQASVSRVQQLY